MERERERESATPSLARRNNKVHIEDYDANDNDNDDDDDDDDHHHHHHHCFGGKLHRKPLIFVQKTPDMFSCKISLKPIQSDHNFPHIPIYSNDFP